MMKIKYPLAIISLVLFFSSCSVQKVVPNENELKSKFGNKTFYWNYDTTFLLIVDKTDTTNYNYLAPLDFLVYSLKTDSVTYKQFLPGSAVGWFGDYTLKIEIQPGNITGDETENDFTFYYDVKRNKKIINTPGE